MGFVGNFLSVSAQSLKEQANSIYKSSSKQVNRSYKQSQEQFNRSADKARENANRTYTNSKKTIQNEYNNQLRNENSYYNNAKRGINGTVNNVGRNIKESTAEATKSIERAFNNTIKNGYQVARYEEQSNDLVTNITIAAFKNVPIYDVENDRLVSMDTYCRDMIKDMGGSTSDGDFGKDPVATSCLILMDDDYMYHAKIIQTPNNDWISINEAMEQGNLPTDIERNYRNTRSAYYSNNSQTFDSSLNNFVRSVQNHNASVQSKSSAYSSTKKMRINTSKSYFHDATNSGSRRRAFCVKNDVVDVLDEKGDWVFVRYNGAKISSLGWMRKINLTTY